MPDKTGMMGYETEYFQYSYGIIEISVCFRKQVYVNLLGMRAGLDVGP
jgi:hypothetical protein